MTPPTNKFFIAAHFWHYAAQSVSNWQPRSPTALSSAATSVFTALSLMLTPQTAATTSSLDDRLSAPWAGFKYHLADGFQTFCDQSQSWGQRSVSPTPPKTVRMSVDGGLINFQVAALSQPASRTSFREARNRCWGLMSVESPSCRLGAAGPPYSRRDLSLVWIRWCATDTRASVGRSAFVVVSTVEFDYCDGICVSSRVACLFRRCT